MTDKNRLDPEIASIIENYRPDQYDDVIAEKEEWEFVYHLSSLRRSLLCWFPFDPGWQVLEPGAGFGALTGSIAECCNHVTALEQNALRFASCQKRYSGNERIAFLQTDIFSLPEDKLYDCVVLADQMEYRQGRGKELLEVCHAHLKPGGVLLLVYQNRFGLKYFCGGTDEVQQVQFGNLPPGKSNLLSRREMERLASNTGFVPEICYYPMPDSLWTQAVYTDSVKNIESIRDRVFALDPFSSARIASEQDLYNDIIHEGMLPHMANSYLAVYRKGAGAELPAVDFALLSTDRGPEHAFATVCYKEKRVEKRPVWPQGIPTLRQAYDNLEKVSQQGVLTVPQHWTGTGIEMPKVEEESLLSYIRHQMEQGPDVILSVFKMLREDILRSSSLVEPEDYPCRRDWHIGKDTIGTVLAEGMIDMIPYNAFWTGSAIRYYDQEFCVKNCPVGYILYRALFYTWLHIPELEQVLPLEQIKKEFGLTENWEAFQERENAFVSDNRKFERFRQVYRWSRQAGDTRRINQNRLNLAASDPLEQRLKMLESVHSVQKELLQKLDQVCREQVLRYTVIHGTLLGAIRHKGFIPWDDDVDIAMPREDYDRLLELAPRLFPEPYFLQTPANSENVFYGGYAKLRRSGTAAIEPQHRGRNCHQGIWIDIFPLDYCPGNREKRTRLQKRITFWQRLLMAKLYRPGRGMPEDIKPKLLSFYYLVARCLRRRWIRQRLEQLFRSCGKSDKLAILACYYGEFPNSNVYTADIFSSLINIPFEDFRIPVPQEYDKILSERYGSKYMELPVKEKRLSHKNIIFSADIPWWEIK